MTWHSLHVHYHEGRFDDLIQDAIRPLFRRFADAAPPRSTRAYFVPHWRQGPHLRLHVDTDATRFATIVRPAADEIVGQYLAERPSTSSADPEAMLPRHEKLAEQEDEAGPLLPWHPDNSIQPADYPNREAILGGPEAAELLADFYVDTTDLTFRMYEHVRDGGSRLGIALGLMVAVAHAYGRGGITSGFLSFRSHAEAFLGSIEDGARLRRHWDRQYEQVRERLTAQVSAVVDTVDSDAEPEVPYIREWLAHLRPIATRGAELIARDAIALRSTAGEDPNDMGKLSEFHRLLVTTDWWSETRDAPWFLRYRLLLNDTYLHLTRLGVTPVERFMLCHLTANAVEDAYGISAMEEIRR